MNIFWKILKFLNPVIIIVSFLFLFSQSGVRLINDIKNNSNNVVLFWDFFLIGCPICFILIQLGLFFKSV